MFAYVRHKNLWEMRGSDKIFQKKTIMKILTHI